MDAAARRVDVRADGRSSRATTSVMHLVDIHSSSPLGVLVRHHVGRECREARSGPVTAAMGRLAGSTFWWASGHPGGLPETRLFALAARPALRKTARRLLAGGTGHRYVWYGSEGNEDARSESKQGDRVAAPGGPAASRAAG